MGSADSRCPTDETNDCVVPMSAEIKTRSSMQVSLSSRL